MAELTEQCIMSNHVVLFYCARIGHSERAQESDILKFGKIKNKKLKLKNYIFTIAEYFCCRAGVGGKVEPNLTTARLW